jgi:hypothetical protein
VFAVSDIGKRGVPQLNREMKLSISRVSDALRPEFRNKLAFLFADAYGKQYLVVYLDGYPQYPILNLCYPTFTAPQCARYCPWLLTPNSREVMPNTMLACADHLPIWRA